MSGAAPLKFLISDIDGTLVTKDKTLTPEAVAAVARLRAAGVAFTVISSRPPRGMASVVDRLQVTLPFAGFNGANIVEPGKGLVEARRLDPEIAETALAILARRGVQAWVFADNEWLVLDASAAHVDHERHTVGFDPQVIPNFALVSDRADKLVGVSDDTAALDAAEAEIRAALGAGASVERSQTYYLDITHPLANKGEAVRSLARMLGFDMAATGVVGDMTNDIAMFKVAGFSVSMGQSPAPVKAAADAVTLSNEDNGFASAIERFFLPRAAR